MKILPKQSLFYTKHKGKIVKVHRTQNINNKLNGEYIKRYRPGKYICPIKINSNVKTIGEIELLKFIENKNTRTKNLLIDIRKKGQYLKETIPSSINIPVSMIENIKQQKQILDFFMEHRVKQIVIYDNGLWDDKSKSFIDILLDNKYPAHKILYYRGGIQMWKILGFTTITQEKNREE